MSHQLAEIARLLRADISWPHGREILIGLACLLAWPGLTEIVRLVAGAEDFYGVPFALAGVLVATLFGGFVIGLAVTLLSVLLLALILPETRIVPAETESVWHLLSFSLIALFVSMSQSASRKLQERLRRETEYKDSFLALMSHELRTPATMIYSGLRLLRLRGSQLSTSDIQEVLAGVESESEVLTQLIDDVLILSQLQNGRPVADRKLAIHRLVEDAVESLKSRCPTRQLVCNLDNGSYVMGQERHLAAVIRHLLVNSERYSSAETPIVVTLRNTDEDVNVSVRDFGPRVEANELMLIFEPYYRGKSLPSGSRGLGLGLTLAKQIIESMGGRMAARSPEGGGLEVGFTLHRAA
jgi:signal transduction histidine kinase